MRPRIITLSLVVLIACSKSENNINIIEDKESCDFTICQEGRVSTDTITDAYGVLRSHNDLYYIEVTVNGPVPDTMVLSCVEPDISLPEIGGYVKFSGEIKDNCSKEVLPSIDSLLLKDIEEVKPIIQENCNVQIVDEDYDVKKIDENLKIHHLNIIDSCLYILISYTGNCNDLPTLTLHRSGDLVGFGDGWMFYVTLQGNIEDDCDKENLTVLRYDLTPVWDILYEEPTTRLYFFFQAQGYLIIKYSLY